MGGYHKPVNSTKSVFSLFLRVQGGFLQAPGRWQKTVDEHF